MSGLKLFVIIVGAILAAAIVVLIIVAVVANRTVKESQDETQNRIAQSSLRNALTAAKTYYADEGAYEGIDASSLQEYAEGIEFVDDAVSNNPKVVSYLITAQTVQFASSSGDMCFGIRDVALGSEAGTFYAAKTMSSCRASGFNASDFSDSSDAW